MALRDPVVAYTAKDNTDAVLLAGLLAQSGIDAFAIEDLSPVGLAWFGNLAEIHRPQVWVERCDLARARVFLEDYEARRQAEHRIDPSAGQLVTVCPACRHPGRYPVSLRGKCGECPKCGEFVDVGGPDEQT